MNTNDRSKAINILLGIELRKAREEFNLSQEYVAQKLGKTKQSISLYEQGKRSLNFADFFKYCEMFGFDSNAILSTIQNTSDYELAKLLKHTNH